MINNANTVPQRAVDCGTDLGQFYVKFNSA